MAESHFVSIILVNYNGEKFLADCLSSLNDIDYPKDRYEVILVDNASKDGSIEMVRDGFPWVRLVSLDRNTGFAEGNNIGAKEAKGEYIVLLNTDTVVEKDWLSELVGKIGSDDRIGACSSQILYNDNRNVINTIGGWWSILGIPGSAGEGMERDTFKNETLTFSPSGCSMIIKKAVYDELGGLDNDYFLYCEDADLGWRLWNKNFKVALAPNSIVYHKVSLSIKGLGKKRFSEWYYFYSARNRFITIIKNARFMDLAWMLPIYFWSHATWVFLFLSAGNSIAAKATLRGMFWFLRDFKWIAKRKLYKKNGYANIRMMGLVDTFKTFLIKKRKHL